MHTAKMLNHHLTTPLRKDSKKIKRKRITKKRPAGLTANGKVRRFVKHTYVDRSNEYNAEEHEDKDNKEMEMYCRLYLPKINGNQDKSTPQVSKRKAFPLKLQYMLTLVEEQGMQHIVSWLPHGRGFIIRDSEKFSSEVMAKYFRQSKLSSFVRQLNIYGFTRIYRGKDKGAYYHEYFLRGKLSLSKNIVRSDVKGNQIRAASSPDDEPDFYAMKFMPPYFSPHGKCASRRPDMATCSSSTTSNLRVSPMMIRVQPKSSSKMKDRLNRSDDFDSDTEILLSPPKTRKLVESIIRDVVDGEHDASPYSTSPRTWSFKDSSDERDEEEGSDNDNLTIDFSSIGSRNRQDQLDDERNGDFYMRGHSDDETSGSRRQRQDDDGYEERNHEDIQHVIENIETKMSKLEEEMNKRGDDIEELRDSRKRYEQREEESRKHEIELTKALEFSAQLLGYSDLGRNDVGPIRAYKEKLERDKQEEIRCVQDSHNEELLRIKEEHKNNLIDLQDRMLQWMSSKVNLVNQQTDTICCLKNELENIRLEYKELKETLVEAFETASESIAINCDTLKSYVKEEISESQKLAKVETERLRNELVEANNMITSLKKIPVETKEVALSSVLSLENSNTMPSRQPENDCRSVCSQSTAWSQYNSKIRDALDGKIPASDVSVDSKLDLYGTMAAEKLFKNLYSKPSSSAQKRRGRKKKVAKPRKEIPIGDPQFQECGQINEDADEFMDAIS